MRSALLGHCHYVADPKGAALARGVPGPRALAAPQGRRRSQGRIRLLSAFG